MTTVDTQHTEANNALDVAAIREQFPILQRKVHGKPLVYLDNAATSQKPACVIDAISDYYHRYNANIHRGLHTLAEEATVAYEAARDKVRAFLNAKTASEIIFTRGTTEAINLVAQAFARPMLKPGDEVLITEMEHHSNLVPWQLVCEQTGATLRWVPITDQGEWDLDAFASLVNENTKLVAFNHVSNSLGTINPIDKAIALAKSVGAATVIDGAQATPHLSVDVQAIDCDFYAFSGHKVYGPTGIGALYGKASVLEAMAPWQGGGEMIKDVAMGRTLYADPPHRFEAGTPDIAGGVGLGVAIDFVQRIGLDAIAAHEESLRAYATEQLQAIDGLRVIGSAPHKAGVVSFVIEGMPVYDVGTMIDQSGVAVRTGHHCTQPVMDRFGVPGTIRASFAMYNTREEVDALVAGLHRVRKFLA